MRKGDEKRVISALCSLLGPLNLFTFISHSYLHMFHPKKNTSFTGSREKINRNPDKRKGRRKITQKYKKPKCTCFLLPFPFRHLSASRKKRNVKKRRKAMSKKISLSNHKIPIKFFFTITKFFLIA